MKPYGPKSKMQWAMIRKQPNKDRKENFPWPRDGRRHAKTAERMRFSSVNLLAELNREKILDEQELEEFELELLAEAADAEFSAAMDYLEKYDDEVKYDLFDRRGLWEYGKEDIHDLVPCGC